MGEFEKIFDLKVELDGINQISVLKKSSSSGSEVVWTFPLVGDDEPIILQEFYTASKFVIVNWDGWIRAFDVQSREKIFDRKMNGSVDSSALLSLDKQSLYCVNRIDRDRQFSIFSLNNFKEEVSYLLPKDTYSSYLQIRQDGALLMYFEDEGRALEDKKWMHGYNVLYPETLHIDRFEMQYPQSAQFGVKAPVISSSKNIGVMPYWGKVEVNKDVAGNFVFVYKIMIFDLDTFDVLQVLPVRDYAVTQLECYESECEEMAQLFSAGVLNDDYNDALTTFCQDLNSIVFDEMEDAFWLGWRGGIVRKVGLDGRLSPLLVAYSVPNNATQGAFEHKTFHTSINKIEADFIILEEHNVLYKMPLQNVDLSAKTAFIPIGLQKIEEDAAVLAVSDEIEQQIKERGKVVIAVDDLTSEKGFQDALQQMTELTKDIDAIGCGDQLAFFVKDNKGEALDDSQFFKAATKIEGTVEKMKAIIENFANYPRAARLYINEEETALCYAVYELACSGPAYIPTIFKYLSVIDEDHDVFNTENLIPFLMETYTNTEYQTTIESELRRVSNGWWLEGMGLEE